MTAALACAVFSGSPAVALSPPSVSGYYSTGGTATTIATGSVIASPSGGVSPYTYAWAQISTSPYTWSIASPAAASTSFSAANIPEGVRDSVTFQVTVTDASGTTATASLVATVRNKVPFPGGTL